MEENAQKQPALRARAEELVRLTRSEISEMTPGNVEAIVHELQVHQIELELQNEELRGAQLSLAESHDRYLDLFDFAPVGYLISDRQGQILEANLTAAKLLQLDRRDLIKKKLPQLAARSGGDAIHCFSESVFSKENGAAAYLSQRCELELLRSDGSSFFARLESIAFESKDRSDVCCRTALIDITEEREAKKWKEQAERLRDMVENLPAGAIFVDSDDRIFLNRTAEEISGFPLSELGSVSDWFRRLYPGQETQTRRLYEESRDAGFPKLLTSRICRKDGCERDIEFAAHEFDGHEVWLVNDITARREAEKKLKERQSHISAILTTAADAIFTVDADGFVIGANPAAEKMFGYESGKLVGVIAGNLMPDLHLEDHGKYISDDCESGGIRRELSAFRIDGSTFFGELSISEVEGLDIYTVILRDSSERKLADEILRERRELSEKLIESAPNIVLVLDLEGRIVRVNPTFEKLTGRTRQDIEGKDWFDHFVPVRNRAGNRALYHTVLSGFPLYEYIDPIIAKEDEERYIGWNAAHLTDAAGVTIGLLFTGNDITDHLRLEGEVITAVEEDRRRIAQELHDGVGSLLTGINFHLGAFKGKIEAKTPLDPSEIEAVASLVSDAIAQSRDIAKGIHPIGSEPEELMSALRKLASRMDAAHPASCLFHCESRVEIKDPVVANQLFRITQEAVNNAVKHSGAGSITIKLSQKDDHISVEIGDDGAGFGPEPRGSEGLGLHIMRYRTRAISGALTITGIPGNGTKVICSVPVKEVPQASQ